MNDVKVVTQNAIHIMKNITLCIVMNINRFWVFFSASHSVNKFSSTGRKSESYEQLKQEDKLMRRLKVGMTMAAIVMNRLIMVRAKYS